MSNTSFIGMFFSLAMCVGGLFVPSISKAVGYSIRLDPSDIRPGQYATATIMLDARGDDINVIEGTVTFDPDTFSVIRIQDAGTPVGLWITKPESIGLGSIPFRGMILGGTESIEQLFSFVVQVKKPQRTSFELRETRALRNDGLGTEVPLIKSQVVKLDVSDELIIPVPDTPLRDTIPPEPFTPIITRDPTVFDGAWFIVFATRDLQSSIASYDVYESPTPLSHPEQNLASVAWVSATSPYRLQDQLRSSTIYVRAIDSGGNERVQILDPINPRLPMNLRLSIVFGIIIAIIALFACKLFFQHRSEESSF